MGFWIYDFGFSIDESNYKGFNESQRGKQLGNYAGESVMSEKSNLDLMPEQKASMSVAKAILIGHVVVNVPVILIILGGIGIGIIIDFLASALFFVSPYSTLILAVPVSVLVGISLGWLWWSFSVPRWRQWALQSGAPAETLHKWAVLTGLEWPKGSVFEKTEFRPKK